MENLIKFLEEKITDKMPVEGIVDVFEQMCSTPLEEDMVLFETGIFTASQFCFPAASNVLALPGGNLIFAATPTERITHYTLQAKSCAKGQAPLETPDNKTG